jgi:hypothetical protein
LRIALLCMIVLAAVSGCGRHESTPRTPSAKPIRPLTAALIARTPDDKLVDTVVDYVTVKIGDDWRNEQAIIASLPKGCGAINAVAIADGEVNNGGFAQYFVNTEGASAETALDGYRMIGAPKRADLLREAIGIALKERSSDLCKEARTDVKAFAKYCRNSSLPALDDRYYALDKSEDVYKLMARYIRSHPQDFIEN